MGKHESYARVPDEKGCILDKHDGNVCLEFQSSISIPIGVIDSREVEDEEHNQDDGDAWEYVEEEEEEGPAKMKQHRLS